jgi:hypothetical protein
VKGSVLPRTCIDSARAGEVSAGKVPSQGTIAQRLLLGWHSLLIYGGDTTIHWHRDHSHFAGIAVMVNLGEAFYMERD